MRRRANERVYGDARLRPPCRRDAEVLGLLWIPHLSAGCRLPLNPPVYVPSQVYTQLDNGTGGFLVPTNMTVWQAGNLLANNLRAVANYPANNFRNLSDLTTDSSWRFLIDNAPSNFATAFVNVQTAQRDNGIALLSRASFIQVCVAQRS